MHCDICGGTERVSEYADGVFRCFNCEIELDCLKTYNWDDELCKGNEDETP
jgi:hypothetical protein